MTDRKATIFVFSPFRMDPARRLLTRDGQPIELKPKEFDPLLVLVEEDGRVVDKEDLMARVWPDCFVSDGSLAKNISVLRKALGEDVIETHRGRGYRIAPPIVVVSSSEAASQTGSGRPRRKPLMCRAEPARRGARIDAPAGWSSSPATRRRPVSVPRLPRRRRLRTAKAHPAMIDRLARNGGKESGASERGNRGTGGDPDEGPRHLMRRSPTTTVF